MGVLDAFPVGGVNSNPVVIGGAVGGVLLLLVLSVVLVVCLVAAIRMRLNKKDSYYAEFARYTRDSGMAGCTALDMLYTVHTKFIYVIMMIS